MPFGRADPNSATPAEVKAKARFEFLPKNFTDDEDVLVRAQHVHQSARGFKHTRDDLTDSGRSGSDRNSTLDHTDTFSRAKSSFSLMPSSRHVSISHQLTMDERRMAAGLIFSPIEIQALLSGRGKSSGSCTGANADFCLACWDGDLELVQQMLANGMDADIKGPVREAPQRYSHAYGGTRHPSCRIFTRHARALSPGSHALHSHPRPVPRVRRHPLCSCVRVRPLGVRSAHTSVQAGAPVQTVGGAPRSGLSMG